MITTSCDNVDMEIGKKIKLLRERKGLTQQELAELIGTTQQTVAYWEVGQRKPRYSKLQKLAEVFGVPISYFLEDKKQHWDLNTVFQEGKIIPVPIYAEAQAGSFGGYTMPTPEKYFPTHESMLKGLPPERVFWIKIQGHSMEPEYHPGDMILVADPSWYEVKEGAPVVVLNGDGELTVKYYHYDPKNKMIVLEPANPSYKPILIPEKELFSGEYIFFPVIAHTRIY
ncbi:repressor LexA [Balnearium lithotrophicum]|uniref:Repressor LexA n=1 Tax=Balnearium lithotrophicum TaxID=223788 RepID=A0A521CQM7_9BACT|nr:XRE family transcriptional regulator [Balnearium lithotrophicum]SMO61774.1 repressor LexA [Balnearium lithotrophicum]